MKIKKHVSKRYARNVAAQNGAHLIAKILCAHTPMVFKFTMLETLMLFNDNDF